VPEPQDVGIAGTYRIPLTVHRDARGHVAESFRRSWVPGMREAVQGNLSRSGPNVLRGLHFHRKQADYWTVVQGSAFIGLFDARTGSPTEGTGIGFELSAEDFTTLYIPKGVAHGYYTRDGLLLNYLVDEYYTGGDEFGIAWDDPDLGIAWPATDPVLSDRDRSNPPLARVLPEAPPFEG
jgi:dTDP-4-dehydrorhamnose 3,5-epimerase